MLVQLASFYEEKKALEDQLVAEGLELERSNQLQQTVCENNS